MLVGVFRCSSCPDPKDNAYLTWILSRTPTELMDELTNEVIPTFESAAASGNEDQFKQAGRALYALIFEEQSKKSSDDDSNKRSQAERAFLDFVDRTIKDENNPGRTTESLPAKAAGAAGITVAASNSKRGVSGTDHLPPSIFMRLLPNNPDLSFSVPLDVMAVRLPSGMEEFLGFHFRVEVPLEIQDYTPSASCISAWRLMVPPPDSPNEMQRARTPFAGWIKEFRDWKDHAQVDYKEKLFDDWLNQNESVKDGMALLTLSHHARGRLCFSDDACKGQAVLSASIRRSFSFPSLALINACGTAQPGASEFIRVLNRKGIDAVIATSTAVDGEMAGQFLKTFVRLLHDSTDSGETLGRVKFETVKQLRERYHSKALAYSLLGNDSIRLCVPPKAPDDN
jgi:hypothetical protein